MYTCMCVWNIWIDVKLLHVLWPGSQTIQPNHFSFSLGNSFTARLPNNLINSVQFFAGGQCTTDGHCPMKTLSVRGDMENLIKSTYLLSFSFTAHCMGHGTWLTQEPPCRLQPFAFSSKWAALQSIQISTPSQLQPERQTINKLDDLTWSPRVFSRFPNRPRPGSFFPFCCSGQPLQRADWLAHTHVQLHP